MPAFKPFDELTYYSDEFRRYLSRCEDLDGADPILLSHARNTFLAVVTMVSIGLPPSQEEGAKDTDDSAALGTEKGGF